MRDTLFGEHMNKTVVSVLALILLVFSTALFFSTDADSAGEEATKETRSTHTVMVEVGTATWCPSCPAANTAWHNIYSGGSYDFEYCEMVTDMNSVADARMDEYNIYWVPTSYYDGGYDVVTGSSGLESGLSAAEQRTVYDIDAAITSCTWLGNASIGIDVSVTNNEATTYHGSIKVYTIELVSSMWNDYNGNPYYHAFLDFPIEQTVSIPPGDTYATDTVWDGAAAGYPGITIDNTQVTLAVFNDTVHTGYSDPPSGAPFNAYYVDETTAAMPGNVSDSTPPNIGLITATPPQQDMYGHVNLTVNVTDNAGVDVVKAIINYPDGSSVNETMTQVAGTDTYSYNTTYDLPGSYLVQIWTQDVNGNTNTSCCPFYFTITDIILPQIPDVTATPASQYAGEHVNITAQATDNVGISTVAVNVTAPGGSHTNATMTRISGTDTYYYNATYFAPGAYSFTVWCDDWEGNSNMSGPNSFTIMDATVDLSFSTGWNLMTVPVANGYNASSLGAAIPGCNIVAYWNASAGMFQSYVVGITPGSGFAIEDGVGYFVYVNTSDTFSVTGAPLSSVAVDLFTGWNTIGWYDANVTSASSLAPSVPYCSIAAYWNASSGTFESYTVGVTPPPGFTITRGMGVFVYVTTSGTWNGQG